MSADIAVVIVAYESAESLDNCLQRVRHADAVGQVRIVDNGSTDDTLHALRADLGARLAGLDAGSPQQDLFAHAP